MCWAKYHYVLQMAISHYVSSIQLGEDDLGKCVGKLAVDAHRGLYHFSSFGSKVDFFGQSRYSQVKEFNLRGFFAYSVVTYLKSARVIQINEEMVTVKVL